ncbi:MAG: acetyl/propionyl/methylcrotonyl-CoA carboxylase subunit alpha [Burkholderiales bacterium]|nr:acetyl/propionyl/methylcrotonyl-CoA carboxylase subunit alpha [Burkholderiales bacterium]
MFGKILIANRGEIACRVIRTARRLGVRTVAVYSAADAQARHVRLADEAAAIGPPPARESYLVARRVIDAALATGAEAIHPGYGFLSENEEFAAACAAAGIVFIGPPAAAIRAMGNKSAAKALMEAAPVPLVPGYHGSEQDAAFLQREADRIGYPVLLKPSAGGGGKGMRIVDASTGFAAALASCKREALSSFGDERVLVEKYITRPRHIEIQIFADTHGNAVHLFERDCSVQRRHQKVLEEAPAPGMTVERRREMGAAAVAAARAVGYVGAGTVEFIADQDGRFYFMEMNTRLQVEHPVTEMITGQDLVEWQLRVAAGEALPLAQERLAIHGHALEARIYAEDPSRGFLPSTGRLVHLALPGESAHVRIDSGVEEGDEITPWYDPMIAKLIVWDETRPRALARMREALAACRIVGVTSNVEFLGRVVTSASFASADLDTGLIEREGEALFPPSRALPAAALYAATAALLAHQAARSARRAASEDDRNSPWAATDAFRLNAVAQRRIVFRAGESEHVVTLDQAEGGTRMSADGAPRAEVGVIGDATGAFVLAIDGLRQAMRVVVQDERHHVFMADGVHVLTHVDPLAAVAEGHGVEAGFAAPMPGKVIAWLAEPGSDVAKGTPLIILEAMKMEHTITAPAAGRVVRFRFGVGEQVSEGAELVEFVVAKP